MDDQSGDNPYKERMKTIVLSLAVMVATAITSAAMASIGGIGNAAVEADLWTVTLRNAYVADETNAQIDGRWRSRLMFDYGIDDDNALGIYLQGDQRRGDNLEMEALIVENRYEWHEAATDGFYSGFRVRYTWRDGDKKPDDAHIRLILGMPYGNWDLRFNQILGWEMGQGSTAGMLVDTRAQVSYGYGGGHRVGIENFSNFGNLRTTDGFRTQQHEVGPILQGPLTEALNYDLGYRYGYSDAAPDHAIRLFLIQRF